MLAMSVFMLAAVTPAASTRDPCAGFDAEASRPSPAARAVTASDLATISDIGRANAHDSESPFGVSPDGQWIAFVVRRANPLANRYCQRLLVAPVHGSGPPREVDRGGAFIRDFISLRQLGAVRSGTARVITPHWSPDGKTLAYLKQIEGMTQIWTVPVSGGDARPATRLSFEVEDFRWAEDGAGWIVAGRPRLAAVQAAIRDEASTGYLYDARFSPMIADHPLPLGDFPMQYFHVEPSTASDATPGDTIRPAAPHEAARLDPSLDLERPPGAKTYVKGPQGSEAWSEAHDPGRLFSSTRLRVLWRDGSSALCDDAPCASVRRIAWSQTEDMVYFLAREGWADSETSLYRWRAGDTGPRRILRTADALVGCAFQQAAMICARESSGRPRRLVAIDLATGRSRLLFDPNPAFATQRLGDIRRLRYRTKFGVEAYSDLVLPPGSRPGDKHPLVVVQYNSEGFLRGGTGDEVPIQALAGRGFAVLSFHRPFGAPGTKEAKNELEYRRLARREWIDRKNVQSALEAGIAAAIATGRIDAARLGISGFSEGTSAAQWALINSRLFKVASLGVCCEDKWALPLNGGIDYETYLREMGYPLFEDADPQFWAPLSLAQNVEKIEAPILIQTGEYKIGLDVLAAFRKHGKAIEMFVLPDEPHVKWQPAHRLAMYERVIDWFAFWLKGERDCTATKDEQYRRWTAMRQAPSLPPRCVLGTGPI